MAISMLATQRNSHLFGMPKTPSGRSTMGEEPNALTILAVAVTTSVRITMRFRIWDAVFIGLNGSPFLIFYWQSFTEGLFLFESHSESFLIHLFL